jgi:hypothetical protein
VPPVQFFIAYRIGHDLVSNKVGSFSTADIFRSEAFFDISSDTGSGSPDAVRSKRFEIRTSLNAACNARVVQFCAVHMIADFPPPWPMRIVLSSGIRIRSKGCKPLAVAAWHADWQSPSTLCTTAAQRTRGM